MSPPPWRSTVAPGLTETLGADSVTPLAGGAVTAIWSKLQVTPPSVPPYGMVRPSALTLVTLPGDRVTLFVAFSATCPSGALRTPPCSMVAAWKLRLPPALYTGPAAPALGATVIEPVEESTPRVKLVNVVG